MTAIKTSQPTPAAGGPDHVPAPGVNGAVPASGATPELTQKPDVDAVAAALVPAEQAVRLRAIPYAFENGRLLVAMLDTSDLLGADEVSVCTGKPVTRVPITRDAFTELLRETHGTTAAQMAARLGGEDEGSD